MKFRFLFLFMALSFSAFSQVLKYQDIPEDLDISRKQFREAFNEFVDQKEQRYDIVLPPLERIATEVEPVTWGRALQSVNISSWGRDFLLPAAIRQRVIDECGANKVVVITVDSGVDPTHPEYAWMKWLPESNYTGQEGRHWHGTHVMGIIYQMVAEVAAKHQNIEAKSAQILNVNGSGSFAWGVNMAKTETALFASRAAAGDGIIFNNSWGANIATFDPLEAEFEKSRKAGMIWIGAAGNAGQVMPGYPGQSTYFTSVASIDPNTKRSSFSTMNDSIDIAMPGSNILSTLPDGKQGNASGTSMASPFAAGLAVLAYGKYGKILQGENMNIYLRAIATDIIPIGRDFQTGYGVVYVTTMLNKNPCDVPGINCGGTPVPDPDPDPAPDPTPDPTPDPGESYVAGTNSGVFQMYWKRESEPSFRVLVVTDIQWQGISKGNETEAFKALQNQVTSYFSNRALVLTDAMLEWSAAKWTGRFLEIVSKINGFELEVESITAKDEFGNTYRASNSDVSPSASYANTFSTNEGLMVLLDLTGNQVKLVKRE